jgi:hypothetical protein
MAKKTRKVSFYLLGLIHKTEDGLHKVYDTHLSSTEIEEKFKHIYDYEATSLIGGTKALHVPLMGKEFVIEILSYDNHVAFMKIGQQNHSSNVALRDQDTLEAEAVAMTDSQALELFTFCIIDFETCIVSYMGIGGAPRISAIRCLFDGFFAKEKTYASVASIMTRDIWEALARKSIISKLTVTVAVPQDDVLSDIGFPRSVFDGLQNVKTSVATYSLTGKRFRGIFKSNRLLGDVIATIREKYGDGLKSLTVNAKDAGEQSQTYDLLQYNFTKTVILTDDENLIPTIEDYHTAITEAYYRNRDELMMYSRQ